MKCRFCGHYGMVLRRENTILVCEWCGHKEYNRQTISDDPKLLDIKEFFENIKKERLAKLSVPSYKK